MKKYKASGLVSPGKMQISQADSALCNGMHTCITIDALPGSFRLDATPYDYRDVVYTVTSTELRGYLWWRREVEVDTEYYITVPTNLKGTLTESRTKSDAPWTDAWGDIRESDYTETRQMTVALEEGPDGDWLLWPTTPVGPWERVNLW